MDLGALRCDWLACSTRDDEDVVEVQVGDEVVIEEGVALVMVVSFPKT